MSDIDHAQKQAQQNFNLNPQTPMVTPQTINDAVVRNAYNAEVARQRSESEKRK
ncbi:hypothetical protein J2Y55_002126 [Bosea sp. BE125]|uniref:hypothetical protein n=1 Tax=Bosea sp. BE125 TaxID=2817909 RepID=UPI00285E653E|nr:hypothetical protein [Bosea sp. BE125]MDR6871118.1 hypothetical protein [Bosea sp. BE125]